jgi:hypothetical protein
LTNRLILLPGLGADARLFAPQAAAFKQLEVPEWLVPRRGESLEDFGRRMAAPSSMAARLPAGRS